MSVYIVSYTEKSIAVFGQTTPIKDHLASIGGKFNPSLTNPQTKSRDAGWIFSKSKHSEVQALVEKANQGQLHPVEVKQVEKTVKVKSDVPEFLLTKEMYLALVSRIERLENDTANLLHVIRSNKMTDFLDVSKVKSVKTTKKQEESDEEFEEEEQKSIPKRSFLF